jgi:hypothetical protein
MLPEYDLFIKLISILFDLFFQEKYSVSDLNYKGGGSSK